jgi:hypothetical protein
LVGVSVVNTQSGFNAITCAFTNASSVSTPTVELVKTTVDSMSTALLANPCTLTIGESTLRSRSTTAALISIVDPKTVAQMHRAFLDGGASVSVLEATAHIENSVFKRVGRSGTTGAFVTTSGAKLDVTFSTLVDTYVACSAQGTTVLLLDSSIVYNSAATSGDTVQGSSCVVTNSVVYPQSNLLGATNITGVLPRLKDVVGDDFHLEPNSPAINAGNPASTLMVDFDGTSRPQGAGRDSGAFEYKL